MVWGAGLGAVFVPAMTASYIGLRNDQIPRATTAVRIFQQVGGSLGTAIFAVILQHQIAHPSGAADGHAAIAAASGTTFWWALGLTALAVVPALLLPGHGAPVVPEAAG